MKLFFVGGLYPPSTPSDGGLDANLLRSSMQELGMHIARAGHELILCSPYEGSIDLEILRGVSKSGCAPRIEMHFPETPENRSAVRELAGVLKLSVQEFTHASMKGDEDESKRYAWLLSQLSAIDTAQAVIAAAGNPAGSANMLLHLAEARRRPILPFGHLGGAASLSLERQRYGLGDRLGDLVSWLQDPVPMERVSDALDRLVMAELQGGRAEPDPIRFFISYPRQKVSDADVIET